MAHMSSTQTITTVMPTEKTLQNPTSQAETKKHIRNVLNDTWAITQQASVRLDQKDKLENALRRQVNPIDQDTLLAQKELELKEVQNELDKRRREHEEMEKKWKEREDVLTKKKQHFIERINDMEIFTKKTSMKIERYTQKAEEEKKQNESKKVVIARLRKEIERLMKIQEEKENYLERISPYQDYLNNVLVLEPSFQHIHKILQRYRRLEYANKQLVESANNSKEVYKKLQNEVKKIAKRGQTKIYQLNLRLSKVQDKLDQQESSLKSEESTFTFQQREAIRMTQQLGQIKMSINNLHDRCVETTKNKALVRTTNTLPLSSDEELLKKIEYIQKRMSDIVHISQKISKISEK